MSYRYVEAATEDGSGIQITILDIDEPETLENISFEEGVSMRVLLQHIFSSGAQEFINEKSKIPILVSQKLSELKQAQALFMNEGYHLLERQDQCTAVHKMFREDLDFRSPGIPEIVMRMNNSKVNERVKCTKRDIMLLISHSLKKGMAYYMDEVKGRAQWN
jgi:hypothetical protein